MTALGSIARNALSSATPRNDRKIPDQLEREMRAGRTAMLKDAPKRRLCARFERGDTYWYITSKGALNFQPTVTAPNGGGKPSHRARNKHNFIRPIVQAKVSATTQRIPSFDITPSTTDPADEGAARLAEQVALYGYDKWRLRAVSIKAVTLAIGHGGDAFALPYFDETVGPFHTLSDGTVVGEGEIKVLVLGGNEVYWQAGVDFESARWWAIERARTIDDATGLPGFCGGKLTPDASASDIPNDRDNNGELVIVTDVYERPTPKFPDGRHFTMANGRMIVDQRLLNPASEFSWQSYPLIDADGSVIDEPILHRLQYTMDPETDRDLGLTWQLIDFQRVAQDAMNKATEWKNRCLIPQWKAPVGSMLTRPDDVPGKVYEYRPGTDVPEPIQVMPIPDSLFRIKAEALNDMRTVAADVNLDAGTDSSAKTLEQVIEQSQNRDQAFLGNVAEWWSRLMRHCLLLTARHYTEPRLLQVRGRYGPYPIRDFRGAQLLGQVDVTVLPGSIENRTHAQVTQQVLAFADRGWVTPQAAMAAIQGGNAEKLIEGFELDVARAHRIIQKIQDGTVMDMPAFPATDPQTGAPVMVPQTGPDGQPLLGPDGMPVMVQAQVPGWMPRSYDTPEVWQHVFADFMKTEAFEELPEDQQQITQRIFDGIQQVKSAKDQQAMMQQTAMAQQLGMGNAASPQDKAMPSQPGGTGTPLPGAPSQNQSPQ